MNASQKRALGILGGIVVVLAVLLIVVISINKRHDAAAAEAASSAADAVTDSGVSYKALTYTNSTATLSFAVDENGEWYWADDPEFPLNSDYITKILNTITGLTPHQTITDGDTLDAYGLSEPAETLTATAEDGSTTTFALGDAVVGDSGSYYMMMNDDEATVYVITDSLYTELAAGIYDMMTLPTLPVLTEDRLSSITVTGTVETMATAIVAESGDAASSADTSADSAPSVSWRSEGANVTDYMADLVSAVAAPTLAKCEDYKPTGTAAALCGFDAPAAVLTVNYLTDTGKNATYTLSVGGTTTDGSSRYVRLDGDTTIYSMPSDALATILSVAASGLQA